MILDLKFTFSREHLLLVNLNFLNVHIEFLSFVIRSLKTWTVFPSLTCLLICPKDVSVCFSSRWFSWSRFLSLIVNLIWIYCVFSFFGPCNIVLEKFCQSHLDLSIPPLLGTISELFTYRFYDRVRSLNLFSRQHDSFSTLTTMFIYLGIFVDFSESPDCL